MHFTENRPSGDPEIGDLHYFAVDVGGLAGRTTKLRFEFRRFANFHGREGGSVST